MKNRILIVEDDRDIRESLALNLDLSGYAYVALEDGAEVVRYLENDHRFDLALLDVMLPGLDGFSLMEEMKRYEIAVIYLTAKTDVKSRVYGLREGAEDYIVKPFEMLELLVRIEKILERTGRSRKTLEYRDLTVDTVMHAVWRGGEILHLQPLEYELLVKLIRFKNCTLSRERLLSEVWGYSYFGSTRTVDTHVSRIRRDLNLNIVTVPKCGYRLED